MQTSRNEQEMNEKREFKSFENWKAKISVRSYKQSQIMNRVRGLVDSGVIKNRV
jgi:hypothetical protein